MSLDNPVLELTCSQLVWGYTPKKALNSEPFSCNLVGPQLVLLMGKNGAGKSCLLRTIGGLTVPLQGQVNLNALPVDSHVATFVFSFRPKVNYMTVSDLILTAFVSTSDMSSLNGVQQKQYEQVITRLQLQNLQHRYVNEISDGEFQRAMIARAIFRDTPLLILDEPTAFLDFHSKKALFLLLQELAMETQKMIICSTHDPYLAIKYGTLHWYIDEGVLKTVNADFITRVLL